MKAEELFLAIGGMEQTRLEKTEQNKPARSGGKLGRRLLIAAVITTGLIGTAFAAVSFYLLPGPNAPGTLWREYRLRQNGAHPGLRPAEALAQFHGAAGL